MSVNNNINETQPNRFWTPVVRERVLATRALLDMALDLIEAVQLESGNAVLDLVSRMTSRGSFQEPLLPSLFGSGPIIYAMPLQETRVIYIIVRYT